MAQRKYRNRPTGIPELKQLPGTMEVCKSYLMDKVFTAMGQKVPVSHKENTVLQQNNAKLHGEVNDPKILVAGSKQFLNIVLQSQPANYPDLGVVNPMFFNALQNLQYKEPCSNIQSLVTAGEKSFDNYSSDKLSKIFITMPSVMHETLTSNGSNDFKLSHKQKYQIEPKDLPPFNIECENDFC